MIVGVLKIKISLPGCFSLKEKRRCLKSMITRLKNEFNLSAAETDLNDFRQSAEIGISIVGNDSKLIQAKSDKIINFIESLMLGEITFIDRDIIHF